MSFDPSPYAPSELWEAAHATQGFSKHLLTIYAIAVGLDAQTILDLGLGSTTKALRLAAKATGGKVHSCDADRARYEGLLPRQDASWSLALTGSDAFLRDAPVPVDFVVHDAAHDYFQVKRDLELVLPKMRTFGIVCVHDTQQPELEDDMLSAIRDAVRGHAVSLTHLPYAAGLAVIRVEKGAHPPRPTKGTMPDGTTPDTAPSPMEMVPVGSERYEGADAGVLRYLRWRLRKIVKGF